ncbi:hypothetical protein EYF80_018244 [Liparis tanakae]|uniref:Uncharacterized protein n=1 Tax=Liparis tanakae TaxID=230148 RepID=A0A4Z2I0X7_9TELE|nr:hypothetical protein EYF80_018244 [Liparis tanakae]
MAPCHAGQQHSSAGQETSTALSEAEKTSVIHPHRPYLKPPLPALGPWLFGDRQGDLGEGKDVDLGAILGGRRGQSGEICLECTICHSPQSKV